MNTNSSIKISMVKDDKEIGTAVALIIGQAVEHARQNSRPYILGCPGGRSPKSTYKALGKLFEENQQSIAHLYIAMMDEYVVQLPNGTFSNVAPSLHFSCRRFAHEEIRQVFNSGLQEEMKMPLSHVLIPDAQDPQSYEDKLTSLGVDCFLLASGVTDGHIAFNGIGSPREARTRVTSLSIQTRTDNLQTFPQFATLDEVPKFGVTVGPETITSLSKNVIMILQGEHKRNAFRQIRNATSYSPDWPATIVSECRNPQIFVDSSAAKA